MKRNRTFAKAGVITASLCIFSSSLFANPARAFSYQDVDTSYSSESDYASHESRLIAKMHHDNQMEVKLAQLALERSKSKYIHRYAKMLAIQHKKADIMLLKMAAKHKIPVEKYRPITREERREAMLSLATTIKLKTMHGKEFDRAYLKAMVADHARTIEQLKMEEQHHLHQTHISGLIAKLLPTLEKHRMMAEKLLKSLK